MSTYKYLSVGNDAKTSKGEKKGYLTGILYLAPHTIGGGRTLCPFSTAGCRAVCLYTAGRGGFNSVQEARIRKTKALLTDPAKFAEDIKLDIERLIRDAERKGMIPAVRLNGTTDIKWEDYAVMDAFQTLQFYDYTKYPAAQRKNLPPNYHLTYSFSEKAGAEQTAAEWLRRHVNVAVVFRGSLPPEFVIAGRRRKVINGDESDLRFKDPKGVVVGLTAKGKARSNEGIGAGHFVQKGIL